MLKLLHILLIIVFDSSLLPILERHKVAKKGWEFVVLIDFEAYGQTFKDLRSLQIITIILCNLQF